MRSLIQIRFLLLVTLTMSVTQLYSQSRLPMVTNLAKSYKNQTRSWDGSPGKAYWQNAADYHIQVSFSPDSRLLTGNLTINYQNNSPDTLKQVVFKLFPNLFQQQAMRNIQVGADDLTPGVEIESMQVDGNIIKQDAQVIRGTNLYLKKMSIPPGKETVFNIAYHYFLNKGSFIRTGQVDSGAFMIAYFFPRIAVYDDIDGWNEYPYSGKEEFYNDYCNFNVAISIPGNYQCWATGDLLNTDSVYEKKFADRITKATGSDSIINIIEPTDLLHASITKQNSWNTWKFTATNVTDFAFAISNHYVWQSSSVLVDSAMGRRTRVDAVYNPAHLAFLPVAGYARKTVALISHQIPGIPFPYPHETIFEGLDATEYPMMVNNLSFENSAAIEFTVHEIFHSLFPFYVGTNETKHSFLDEGWCTFAELDVAPLIERTLAGGYDMSDVNNYAGSDQDVPIMTLTPQLYGKARFADKDLKPALGFHYVREMLGDRIFLQAMQYFITTWHGKHPTPFDFFYCMNKGAGKDLNWFWKNWFFEKSIPDLAIAAVRHTGQHWNISVTNIGGAAVPVHVTINYKDGSSRSLSYPIAVWEKGNKSMTIPFTDNKPIASILLGTSYDADIDKANNYWPVR